MKRAIKINAKEKKLEVVQWEKFEDLQRHVGGYIERVETQYLPKHAILVDEEGLFKDYTFCFRVKGYPQILAGNGLIVGDTGESFVSATLSPEDVEDVIQMLAITEPEGKEDA